jgi:YVTN family beta-propeller protein
MKYTVSYTIILVLGMTSILSSTFSDLEKVWAGSVIKTIPVGKGPQKVAFNPANNDIYVINGGSNTVSVINSSSNTVIKTIPVGSNPNDMAFNPANNDIYVVNWGSNNTSVIDRL